MPLRCGSFFVTFVLLVVFAAGQLLAAGQGVVRTTEADGREWAQFREGHDPRLDKGDVVFRLASSEPAWPRAADSELNQDLDFLLPPISDETALWLGQAIWMNECPIRGRFECLTWWNKGEEFASLGIGHFIWYPRGYQGPYKESFPALLRYFMTKGITIPGWIASDPDLANPWQTREAFARDSRSMRLKQLRQFLLDTLPYQADFQVRRMERALPRILSTVQDPMEKKRLRQTFYAVAAEPTGLFVLVDYVNFKGEGVSPSERYKGQGWGLLQVLQEMRRYGDLPKAVQRFAAAADYVLTRRVKNAPTGRNEQRWLEGWGSRVKRYTWSLSRLKREVKKMTRTGL